MITIIIYGLHVVFCSSAALRASALLAPETLIGEQKIVGE